MKPIKVTCLTSSNGTPIRIGQTIIGTDLNSHTITGNTTVCEVVNTELYIDDDNTETPRLKLRVLGSSRADHVKNITTHIGREFIVADPNHFTHYDTLHHTIFISTNSNITNKFKRFDLITGTNENTYSFTHARSICIVQKILDKHKIAVRKIGTVQPDGFIQVGTQEEFYPVNAVESEFFDHYNLMFPPGYTGYTILKHTNIVSKRENKHVPAGMVFKVLYDLDKFVIIVASDYLPIHPSFGLDINGELAAIFMIEKKLCMYYDKEISSKYYIEDIPVKLINGS